MSRLDERYVSTNYDAKPNMTPSLREAVAVAPKVRTCKREVGPIATSDFPCKDDQVLRRIHHQGYRPGNGTSYNKMDHEPIAVINGGYGGLYKCPYRWVRGGYNLDNLDPYGTHNC